jgi:hypothetical protein
MENIIYIGLGIILALLGLVIILAFKIKYSIIDPKEVSSVLYPDRIDLGFIKESDIALQSIADSMRESENDEIINGGIFALHDIVQIIDNEDNCFEIGSKCYILGFDETDGSYLIGDEFNKAWVFACDIKKARRLSGTRNKVRA